ncbi:MAG TPA: hypothetical protein ENK23_01275 [Sorangium sp.]|nr:hypothetical protein [Sorangium sp.]
MPVCFIALSHDGFWCRDDAILVWAALLAQQIHHLAGQPTAAAAGSIHAWTREGWARALAACLEQLATHHAQQVTLQLGDYLETPGRRQAMVHLSERCRIHLTRAGLASLHGLPATVAAPLCARDPGGALARVRRTADAFLWLLGGPRLSLPAAFSQLFASPSRL